MWRAKEKKYQALTYTKETAKIHNHVIPLRNLDISITFLTVNLGMGQ